jgi:hypothetical protein
MLSSAPPNGDGLMVRPVQAINILPLRGDHVAHAGSPSLGLRKSLLKSKKSLVCYAVKKLKLGHNSL